MNGELKPFKMSTPAWAGLILFAALGAIALYMIALEDSTRAWFNYLIGSVLFLGMGLFGLFFILVNNIVASRWTVVLRRLFEAMALTLPVSAVLIFVIYWGRHSLFEWSHVEVVLHDELLAWKEPFLNEGFFLGRLISYFVIWIGSTIFLVKKSLTQDSDGKASHTLESRSSSAILMVFFALSVTSAGFDLVMSLDPHWFSTIFGVYFFAGFFQAGLAMLYLITAYLYKKGYLDKFLNEAHFHDIGKYIFAFSIFWAYIGFSQFMLIWYADLPEETFWYKVRMTDGWEWIGLLMLGLRWALPFLVLLPFGNKMNFKIAVPVCCALIFGQWVDLYWNAMPATRLMHHVSDSAHGHAASHFGSMFSWQEVLVGAGFVAFFLICFGLVLQRLKMVPLNDPRIEESLHHHI